jgi:hypothetical protein
VSIFSAVHQALLSKEQISDASLCSKLDEINLAHQVFKRAQRAPDLDKSLQKEECSEKVMGLCFSLKIGS